jgi:hypothetical protein
MTRETVAVETPANFAISLILTLIYSYHDTETIRKPQGEPASMSQCRRSQKDPGIRFFCEIVKFV